MILNDNAQPLVSILINNYNYGHCVNDAIDSVLNQTYPNVEVIVVDDGSTDKSREVIQRYGDRIIPVFKKNGGQASAMNAGFTASHGQIICLLDSDDLFLPEKVAEVVRLFQVTPDAAWVFTESAPIENKELIENDIPSVFQKIAAKPAKAPPRRIDFRANLKSARLPNFTPSTSNLCFSRSLLEKIFPLPEIKGFSGMAITDLFIELLAVGLTPGCVTVQELGIYRFHDNYYKTLDLSKKRRMFSEIYITTGYWIQERYPEFYALNRKLISKGFGTYLSTDYLRGQSTDANCEKMMQEFLKGAPFWESLRTYLMVFYYWSKLRFKDFV